MTTYFVGPAAAGAADGSSWNDRFGDPNDAENVPVVPGDKVIMGPGVYRVRLDVDVSGGNLYNAGTVSVTKGSATVAGAGTAWLANVAVGDIFRITAYADAWDGVANGTATFTSAGGNFQAAMIGKEIGIEGRDKYRVGAVAAANSITLTDPWAGGWPAAGAGLGYSVPSGEGPYEVASVDADNQITLTRPWDGRTLTGLTYLTYTPITYIGDETGENTDGIGGIVRVTASDNDQVAVRWRCILAATKHYRSWRGFSFDTSLCGLIRGTECDYWTIEDCTFQSGASCADIICDQNLGWSIRRCVFLPGRSRHIYGAVDPRWALMRNCGHVIESCVFLASGQWCGEVQIRNYGDGVIKRCLFVGGTNSAVHLDWSPIQGRPWVVSDCVICAHNNALSAVTNRDLYEDYNTLYANEVDRLNVPVGPNSVTYPQLLQPPLLYAGEAGASGFKFPWWFAELSEWSQVRAITGLAEPGIDLRGITRPVTAAKNSWGAVQFTDAERDTGTVYAGAASMEISDAGRMQFKVPCTNRAYMVRVRVQREANYAGVNPQIVIRQPGQADRTTVDAGAAGAWNLLEDTFTPAVDPEYFFVELVSNNTAAAGNYATYFDNLEIRGEPQDPGEFEHWLWDRQPLDILPANALVVSGREYRRRRVPGEVSAMEEQC